MPFTMTCTVMQLFCARLVSPLFASYDDSATFYLHQHRNGKRTASRNVRANISSLLFASNDGPGTFNLRQHKNDKMYHKQKRICNTLVTPVCFK